MQKNLLKMLKAALNTAENGLVEFSSPENLYLSEEQAIAYETATTENRAYQTELDKPILEMMASLSDDVANQIKGQVHFIDLGPGFPQKSLVLIDRLIQNETTIRYYAVDVSQFFLDRAKAAIIDRGLPAGGFNVSFEKLASRLDRRLMFSPATRVCFLGLTFNNFELDHICKILSEITHAGDIMVICYQTPDSRSESQLVSPYKNDTVKDFCFLPLKAAGLDEDNFEFEVSFRDHAARVGFRAIQDIRVDDMQIPTGTLIETSASYRFPKHMISERLDKHFEILSEQSNKTGMHVAALIRKGN